MSEMRQWIDAVTAEGRQPVPGNLARLPARLRAVVGEHLGSGAGRDVYAHKHRPDLAVKVQKPMRKYRRDWLQNHWEMKAWEKVKGTPRAKWFAPCEWIAKDGMVLFQRRTTKLTGLPKRMPALFFAGMDFQEDNLGMLDGRAVWHDYGLLNDEILAAMDDPEWWEPAPVPQSILDNYRD